MIESPSNGRAKISKDGSILDVRIPTRKNWFVIIFLSAWMGGWVMGETFALTSIFVEETPLFANAFLLVWLTAWTAGGMFCITIILWLLAGQETIKVENGVIELGKQIFNLKRSKKYAINEVRHLSLNLAADHDIWGMFYQRNLLGLRGGGMLKFDYGMQTVKFANGIDEAEGRLVIEILKKNPNFKEQNFG